MTRPSFTRAARQDLDSIIDYIAVDDPPAAERVFRIIVAAVEGLVDFPGMGRPGRLPNTRELVTPALPYIVVYEVDAGAVTVLAVFHGAGDLARALAERRHELKR